jgi:hypothetical protein
LKGFAKIENAINIMLVIFSLSLLGDKERYFFEK